ncbi:hypothetical protein EDM60_05140 [Brevibacillus parabrevis]|nr:hypothetical protein EDM60_05140 [Brevibacillus parabrevis]
MPWKTTNNGKENGTAIFSWLLSSCAESRVFFARFFFFVCFDYTSTGNQPVFFCWQNVMSEAKQLCRLGRGGEPY